MMMAKVTVLVCDPCLARGVQNEATQRNISIDSFKNKPELCDGCYDEIVAPFIAVIEGLGQPGSPRSVKRVAAAAVATPARKKPARKKPAAKKSAAKKSAAKRAPSRKTPNPVEVREWAASEGIEVPKMGKIRGDVVDKFMEAKAAATTDNS